MSTHRLLRKYIVEVLTGFKALNAMGRDRAQGNIRWEDTTLSQKNRGIFDDLDDEEARERQDAETVNDINHTINKHTV